MFDVAIIGAGASGLTCAINASFEGLSTVMVEKGGIGGQAATTSKIENYPGFPQGIDGQKLMSQFYMQAERLGTHSIVANVTGFKKESDTLFTLVTENDTLPIVARSVVFATGLSFRRLHLPGSDNMRGLYYGPSVHQAPSEYLKNVAVLGAANSAGQAAINLAKYASSVYVINKKPSLDQVMSSTLIKDIATLKNVQVINKCNLATITGKDNKLHFITLDNGQELPVSALFVCIGQLADTSWLQGSGIDISSTVGNFGKIIVDENLLTSIPGVFAIGDVRNNQVHRVSTAVGDGSRVVQHILDYLKGKS